METETTTVIGPNERGLAAFTHLSGLAGYIIPLGGVVVPIIIMVVKSDSKVISTIAKQAVWLNVAVFLAIALSAILMLTVILIPVVIVFWILLGLAAVALPVIGALKANDGVYYRYPWIGLNL
ncbi:MAG: DUF4870 domain-containing protein [Acidobacteria bacterium]|uniref:DUF4870 domain-containing protein n=1 Tax=Candidatus Polarisedimenticola svalbardensis TaxID=2886004 RepID=A0A8J6YA81_9BACT|nr:DUF4870 domain-containing protein [Candidatus Polarisedimenticola svalbardensis]